MLSNHSSLKPNTNGKSCHSCFSQSVLKPNTEITSHSLPLDYSVKERRIGHRLEYVLEFTEDDVKACKSLFESIKQNVSCFQFKTDAEHLFLDRVWRPISHSLLQYDIKWDPNKCEQSFKQLVKLYKQVLKKAPNRYIASQVYPLFEFIYSFDLKPFLNEDYNKLSEYINKFESKFKFEIKLRQFSNPISSAVKSIGDQDCGPPVRSLFRNRYRTSFTNRPELLLTSLYNTGSSSQITTDSWNSSSYSDANVFTKYREFSAEEVDAYQTLLKSISDNLPKVKTIPNSLRMFQRYDLNGFWGKVSQLMKSKGFDDWSRQKCQQSFNESLHIYKNVLIKAPNRLMASESYRLFDIIQAFDLKLYPEIQVLEKEFEKKCGQC